MKILMAAVMACCCFLPAFSQEAPEPIKLEEISPILEQAPLIDDLNYDDIPRYQGCGFKDPGKEQQACLKTAVMRRYKDIFNVVGYLPHSTDGKIREGIARITEEIESQKKVLAAQKNFTDNVFNDKECFGGKGRMDALDGIENARRQALDYCLRYRGRDDTPPSACLKNQFFGIRADFQEKMVRQQNECAAAKVAIERADKSKGHMETQNKNLKKVNSDIWGSAGNTDTGAPENAVPLKSKSGLVRVNENRDSYKPEKYKRMGENNPPPRPGETKSGYSDGTHVFSGQIPPGGGRELSVKEQWLVDEARSMISGTAIAKRKRNDVLNAYVNRCQAGYAGCEESLRALVSSWK